MRDPKTGFVAVQALAPAVYSGSPYALPSGSYFVENETRWENKIDQSTEDLLHGVVTPGPVIDMQGFNSAVLIIDIGASTPSPTPGTYNSAEFGFGVRLQYELFPDAGIYEDCYDLRMPFPWLSGWAGFKFFNPNQVHQINIVISHRKYRLVTMVKSGFSVAASATLLKGHPANHPAT